MWGENTTEKKLVEVAASYLEHVDGAMIKSDENWAEVAQRTNEACAAMRGQLEAAARANQRSRNRQESAREKALLEELEAVFPKGGYTGQQCRDKMTALAGKVRPCCRGVLQLCVAMVCWPWLCPASHAGLGVHACSHTP